MSVIFGRNTERVRKVRLASFGGLMSIRRGIVNGALSHVVLQ